MIVYRPYDQVKKNKDNYIAVGERWIDLPTVRTDNLLDFGWEDVNRVLYFKGLLKLRFIVSEDDFHICWFVYLHDISVDTLKNIMSLLGEKGKEEFIKALNEWREHIWEGIVKIDTERNELMEKYDRLATLVINGVE